MTIPGGNICSSNPLESESIVSISKSTADKVRRAGDRNVPEPHADKTGRVISTYSRVEDTLFQTKVIVKKCYRSADGVTREQRVGCLETCAQRDGKEEGLGGRNGTVAELLKT